MIYPDCSFPLTAPAEIYREVEKKLAAQLPFSLVRLGDGEGVLLSVSDRSPAADIRYLEAHLGPEGAKLDHLQALRHRLLHAARSADVVGVRDDILGVIFGHANFELSECEFLHRFHRTFKLRTAERTLAYAGCSRIALLHRTLSDLNWPESCRFCSAWIHYEFHLSGALFRWLQGQKVVGLVSSRGQLPALLERLFGIAVRHTEIPEMYRDLSLPEHRLSYISRLEAPLSRRIVEFPGMLVLIGGGLYGKLYCQAVKAQGGVAIDVGALLDAWLGIASRPAVYRTMSGNHEGVSSVPPDLLLTPENIYRLSSHPEIFGP